MKFLKNHSKVMKSSNDYVLVDVSYRLDNNNCVTVYDKSLFNCKYQIIEFINGFAVCGEFSCKKEAIKTFNHLNKVCKLGNDGSQFVFVEV